MPSFRGTFFWSLLLLRAPAAASQDTNPLQAGTRIHVSSNVFSANPYAGPTLVTASFVEMRNDSLFLQLDRGQSASVADGVQPIGIPMRRVTGLSVLQGKSRAVKEGARLGFAVGLVGGLVVALKDKSPQGGGNGGNQGFGVPDFSGFKRPMEVLAGGMIGAVLGVGVGSLFPVDRWVPVSMDRLRVTVYPRKGQGGVGLGVRAAF